MRVLCSGMDGSDVEGEVIGGEFYDPDTGRCDLEETFTVRDDHGKVFQVHDWMVDVTVLEEVRQKPPHTIHVRPQQHRGTPLTKLRKHPQIAAIRLTAQRPQSPFHPQIQLVFLQKEVSCSWKVVEYRIRTFNNRSFFTAEGVEF